MINRKDQVTSCGATYVSRTDTFPDIRTVIQESSMKVNENGIWRIKTNQELDKIIKHKNVINFIRAQRLGWLGHIERMQETRMVKAIYCWKHI